MPKPIEIGEWKEEKIVYVLSCPDCTGQMFYVYKDGRYKCCDCGAFVTRPDPE